MIFFSAMIVDCMGLIYSMAIYLWPSISERLVRNVIQDGMECTSSREKIELQRQQITSLRGRILTSSYQSQMNVSKKEPEMFILINHNFTIISLLHCANSKPKFRNQFMTQLTVRNKNCILRDNIMHIQSLHFNTFIISCEIRSDFPLSVSTDRNGPTFILTCCRS